jgi:hypothetical protein
MNGWEKLPSMLVVMLFAAALGQQQGQPAELAHLFVYADLVNAEGVWRPDNLDEKTELAFDAVTRLECYKHGGDDLVDTDAYCAQMTASTMLGVPDIDVEYFPVITWDKEKIIAANSSTASTPVCFWTQITVNLQDHSIMATDTRKLGKGHEGINDICKLAPLAQTYHLVDKTQELTRRRLRAAQLAKQKS